jgi:hypothetical protein
VLNREQLVALHDGPGLETELAYDFHYRRLRLGWRFGALLER